MKKIIAVTMVALMMLTVATSAFALVTDVEGSYKNPPVFISGLTVSDAYMSGLTTQNWAGSLTNQAYAEGSYIWFVARVSVAAEGSTDAAWLWRGGDWNASPTTAPSGQAKLVFTGKDNCLNFTSANMATLAKISGMNVIARQISGNNLGIVETGATKASFVFQPNGYDTMGGFAVDSNGVVYFDLSGAGLSSLYLDGIYAKNAITSLPLPAGVTAQRATLQKDYYLHFMAITNAATEGVCIGTMTLNSQDEFERIDGNLTITRAAGDTTVGMYPSADYSTSSWWTGTTSYSGTQLLPGDRSEQWMLFNTLNSMSYSVMTISNVAPVAGNTSSYTGGAAVTAYFNGLPVQPLNTRGAYGDSGVIYVLMNKNADKVICGFVVDGTFKGLVGWDPSSSAPKFNSNTTGRDPRNYVPITSNDLSAAIVQLVYSYGDKSMTTSELQSIFDFLGFAYTNGRAPSDVDFLTRTKLVTSAEAKYNVANAVITVPDATVTIPKTGDAATSTGLILVASAILAAAAVGFVLSKRAHN